MMLPTYLLPIFLAPIALCRPTAFVQDYLAKYGYIGEGGSGDAEELRSAIGAFQVDVGLERSGEIGKKELEIMRRPRCGTPNKNASHTRRKRFVPHRSKWPSSVLTWKLSDPYDLLKPYDQLVVKKTLQRSFEQWSSASRQILNFKELEEENGDIPDIQVFFARGPHNDTLPFDGKNGVVAHGFYPTEGKLHFDAAEKWTLNLPHGINLFQTAVHEIGHLLGLEHSNDFRAVMFPINRPYDPDFTLSEDDVRGIRFLYSPWAWRFYWSRYLDRWWKARRAQNHEEAL